MITQTTWKKTSVTTPHSLGNSLLLDPPPPISPWNFCCHLLGGGGIIHVTLTKGAKKSSNSAGKPTFLQNRNYIKYKCKSQGVSPQGAHYLLIQLLYIEVHMR